MATQITLSGGAFQDAQGNVLANGTLVLRLTSDAVTTDAVPEKQILGNIPITISLDASGNVSGTPKIWSNAELSPSGTGYSVLAFSAAGAPSWKTSQTWVFNQAGGSTVDLGTMVPTSTGVSYSTPIVGNPSGVQTITNFGLILPSICGILFVDGVTYTTIQAAVNALGSNQGLVIVPASYAGAAATVVPANVTIWNLTGATPPNLNTISFNSTSVSGLHSMINATQTRTNPPSSDLAGYFNNLVTGTMPNGQSMDGMSSEVDLIGALLNTPTGVFSLQGAECDVQILSTGFSIPMARGGIFYVNTGALSTTNVTEVQAINANSCNKQGSGVITNAYGLVAERQIAGSTLNYSIYSKGAKLQENGFSWDVKDAGGIIHKIMDFRSNNNIVFHPLGDNTGVGWEFDRDDAGSTYLLMNPTDHVKIPSHTFSALGGSVFNPSGTGININASGDSISGATNLRITNTHASGHTWDLSEVYGSGTFDIRDVTAGGAYSFVAGANRAIFSQANAADRTYTLPDATVKITGVVASTSQKAESAADASVLSFTTPAVVGSYRVRFVLSVSAASAATLGWTATWKDSNGNAQAPTNLALSQTGVAAPALTFVTSAAGNYYGEIQIDTDATSTAIVVKLTFAGTSFAGKATATIERIV